MTEQERDALLEALDTLGLLLELDGANPFKSGAYARGARALKGYDGDIAAASADGSILGVEGIGKGIAEKVAEYCTTGRIAELEELRAKFPPGLLGMTEVPGFGAKKARAVWQALGVDSLEGLEEACRSGALAGLKGFGEKTAANILAGIEQMKRHRGRFRLDVADASAEPVLQLLRSSGDVARVEIGGSLRRRMETVKDIDFLVESPAPDRVMELFTTMPSVERVLAHGSTKSSVILGNGMQADLRVVGRREFAFALHHFTGSREHNTAMRRRAKERGLRLSEWGVFPEGSEDSLEAADEAGVFGLLGLAWIAPELREDMGEIAAAEAGALPRLVSRADVRGIPHLHTHWSDGAPRLDEYAAWAHGHGIAWMGITDHSQTAAYAGGLKPGRVAEQQAEIDRVNGEWAGKGVRLLKGIESDILADGSLDYDEGTLSTFDFVVASVHSRLELDEGKQTERLIRAVSHPATTILGHMTGRLLLRREGLRCDTRAVIRACAAHGVAIEINGNPQRLDLDWRHVRTALEEGCQIALGPDAHTMAGLGHLEYAIAMGRKGWLTAERCVNCLGTEDFLAFARKSRKGGGR